MPRIRQNAERYGAGDAMRVEIFVIDPKAKPLSGLDEDSRLEIGRRTYRFVRRCMQDPELRARIQTRAAEIRASGKYGLA